ncbi:MAG: hypothetical protein AB9834_09730 [Lentimicrobium sp.]
MEDPAEYKTKQTVIFHNQLPQKGIGRNPICLYLNSSEKHLLIQLFDKELMNERSLLSSSDIRPPNSCALDNQKHQDIIITLLSTRAQIIDQL